jgi:CheR methyltransferase, SAM binding domain
MQTKKLSVLLKTSVFYKYYRSLRTISLKGQSTEAIFTNIFENNSWGGESISGPGSDENAVKGFVDDMANVLKELKVASILDIPCGDFYWMKNVDLQGIEYIGADIVQKIILDNIQTYATDEISFIKANLISDPLPKVDIVFCRDCLVHFSYKDIDAAIRNICDSGSRFLMTTHFPESIVNRDIFTGDWRALNLESPPFNLPDPLKVIRENYVGKDGLYNDKSLALWDISELKKFYEQST